MGCVLSSKKEFNNVVFPEAIINKEEKKNSFQSIPFRRVTGPGSPAPLSFHSFHNNVQVHATSLKKTDKIKDSLNSSSFKSLPYESKVEVFLNVAFSQCSQVSTLKAMLESPAARSAFEKFSKTVYAEENICFFKEIQNIKKCDVVEMIPRLHELSENFLKPGASSEINIDHNMKSNILTNILNENNENLLAALEDVENEIITVMALGSLPRFLKSTEYLDWRRQENLISSNINPELDNESAELALNNNWLNIFFRSAELLPVCITLATANKSRYGFPLIYVNKHFENVTGYERSDIIGSNCKFLQAEETEAESINTLSEALRNALPVKVSITNYRKDGIKFENLLSMKPIFDQDGIYRFVLGIQFDSSDQRSNPSKLLICDTLLNLIPDNIIYTKECEEVTRN